MRTGTLLLVGLLLAAGLGGECRWSYKSGNRRSNNNNGGNPPPPLTLGGVPDSIVAARGGRALLYTIPGTGEIRWLDLETGHSWPILSSVRDARVEQAFETGFRFRVGGPDPDPYFFSFDNFSVRRPDPGLGPCLPGSSFFGNWMWVTAGSLLFSWGCEVWASVPLRFDALGGFGDPAWPAPLAWDWAGDLFWVDLASGAGVPVLASAESNQARLK